jgi:L,D-peptidoglycan transpeptidase YkuD (ErfK/YbiS/YcfS/YnhG family)
MRARLIALVVVTVASLGVFVAGLAVLPTPTAAAVSPAGQIITVRSGSATATSAVLDLWQKSPSGAFAHAYGPVLALVGELGIGRTAEGLSRTPAGVFGLTQAFGNRPSNGTRLPYFQANRADWWNGESSSPAYNTHVHQTASPGPHSENLYDIGYVYSHAVVIDYNRFPVVKGAGSAFFLHVTNFQPTGGCVAVPYAQLDTIMRWLDPAQHPVISIGVGSAATAPVTQNNAAVAKHNPFGYLDTVVGVGGGKARLSGWSADPDNTSAALQIHIYVDGHIYAVYRTGVPRPDVARIMHTGPNQGYSAVVSTSRGSHTVCAFAINIGLGTTNPLLGCRAVTVS